MALNLSGKVALITGSNRGLGRAIAIEFAKRGANVIINYRKSRKGAEETLRQIRTANHIPQTASPILIKADVSKEADVKRLFSQIFRKFKRVDILVNNVGNFCYCALGKLSNSEFRNVIESNLYGTFFCSKEVLPRMRKQRYGKIINLGCAGCERVTVREKTTPYYIAKTGVYMLTKAMAAEEAKHGININMVSPGILETSVVKHKVPAGRHAKFEDIINAILFLLDSKSNYIHGANIEVSGGWVPGHGSKDAV